MKIALTVAAGLTIAGFAQVANAGNVMHGQQLFNTHCSICHGMRGEGVMPDAPKFRLGERLDQPDMMLMQSVKNGKNKMPPFFGVLKDPDVLDILSYVRTLR
ncbi:MAG TPA: c-type cytochrome [Rhodocyclaceae bacterium]|nr:c-type cytochrome [Rhodocyclaceae bacterium]